MVCVPPVVLQVLPADTPHVCENAHRGSKHRHLWEYCYCGKLLKNNMGVIKKQFWFNNYSLLFQPFFVENGPAHLVCCALQVSVIYSLSCGFSVIFHRVDGLLVTCLCLVTGGTDPNNLLTWTKGPPARQ